MRIMRFPFGPVESGRSEYRKFVREVVRFLTDADVSTLTHKDIDRVREAAGVFRAKTFRTTHQKKEDEGDR